MSDFDIKIDSTDQEVTLRWFNLDGTPASAIEHNTGGIAAWYRRAPRGLKVAITLQALAALNSAHADGGIEYISDGNTRLDLPDAAVARGANRVEVGGSATGLVAKTVSVRLYDDQIKDEVAVAQAMSSNAITFVNGTKVASGDFVTIKETGQTVQIIDMDPTNPSAKIGEPDPDISPVPSDLAYTAWVGAGAPVDEKPEVTLDNIGGQSQTPIDLGAVLPQIYDKVSGLTFTKPGEVDANARSNNSATIYGTGQEGDLWRGEA